MIVTLQTQAIPTLDQVRALVAGNLPVSFILIDRPQRPCLDGRHAAAF